LFADDYKDYQSFSDDTESAEAIESLTALGVLQGSDGYLYPDENLVRSEFATINQRLVEGLGLSQ